MRGSEAGVALLRNAALHARGTVRDRERVAVVHAHAGGHRCSVPRASRRHEEAVRLGCAAWRHGFRAAGQEGEGDHPEESCERAARRPCRGRSSIAGATEQ